MLLCPTFVKTAGFGVGNGIPCTATSAITATTGAVVKTAGLEIVLGVAGTATSAIAATAWAFTATATATITIVAVATILLALWLLLLLLVEAIASLFSTFASGPAALLVVSPGRLVVLL